MMSVKNFFLKKKLDAKRYNLTYKSWQEIRDILLLFKSDTSENNSQVKKFIKSVKNENKNIVACCFVDKRKSDTPTLDDYIVIDKSNVNFLEKPKLNHIEPLLNAHYDVMIDITETEVVPLAYVMSLVDYGFSCGVKKENFGYYDFVLDFSNKQNFKSEEDYISEDDFSMSILEQMVKYLKMIKSK